MCSLSGASILIAADIPGGGANVVCGRENKYLVKCLRLETQIQSLALVALNQVAVCYFVFVSGYNPDYALESVGPDKDSGSCGENNSCLVSLHLRGGPTTGQEGIYMELGR